MKPRLSLTKRIALSYVLLTIIVSSAFILVFYLAVEVIEYQVIDRRLANTASRLIEIHANNESPNSPPEIRVLVDNDIPAELQQLPPGFHALILQGRHVHVVLRDHADRRYAVLQEVEEFKHTEKVFLLSLGAGFIVSVLLAAAIGVFSARRVISPVTALADAVKRNATPTELPSLRADDEIGVLARAFTDRTQELHDFLERERLFTGDVSHELRTPLTIMLGAAEILTTQLSDQPAQHATAERIRRVAAETSQRLGALLLLARVPEKLGAPQTDLNELIESELNRCRPLLKHKPVAYSFEWTERVEVRARPELVGIVIGNLLRNACRHTEEGTVLIQLASHHIVIEDSGAGLPPHVRERLFERFIHDNNPPEHEGMGLGLSIVKRVVDHLGWGIRLETPQAGGTRFVLTFPQEQPIELS